ncbi:MAG: amylo-alpha-1,6-glucosidase [Myxococcaceae bacterium]
MEFSWLKGPELAEVRDREWLVTNGLGGYASGTLMGLPTRRHHGYFVPALASPHGRTVLLSRLTEVLLNESGSVRIDAFEREDGVVDAPGLESLRTFRLVGLIPEWEFEVPGGGRLRKRLVLVHGSNTLHVSYRNESGRPLLLRIRPWWVCRMHDRPLQSAKEFPRVELQDDRDSINMEGDIPDIKVRVRAPAPAPLVALPEISPTLELSVEHARGYDHHEQLRSPGYHDCTLLPDQSLVFSVTVAGWEDLNPPTDEAFENELARERSLLEQAKVDQWDSITARLVLAADQFVIEPSARPADESHARARGENARSVIAGYPWFTDWGRDTMISLEGLTLSTGRTHEAADILRTFCHHVRHGLLPNLFPEGGREGLYHTADATLWLFHALHRYLVATADHAMLRELFPVLQDVIAHHLRGTLFGIGVDPEDGLLRQGQEHYQLTWMDAKVDDWVVTPRRGKAVEINALWFNALKLMTGWAQALGQLEDAGRYAAAAEKTQASFNRRFWNPSTQSLYDVVDGERGDDPAIRPNQVFAISLDRPVLRPDLWPVVLKTVQTKLLTPVGLRTLSEDHSDYRANYDGDLRSRDAAYHQGTVWPWLLGHYVDAIRRIDGSTVATESIMQGLCAQLRTTCAGQVSEIFDATPPFRARGCFAQAWSVAEFLRVWRVRHPEPPPT